MKKICYTKPYVYPSPESGNAKTGYKDRNNKPITKWFIKYNITFDDGVKIPRKEYGNSYDIDLNRIKNLKTKMYEANILRDYVEDDLKNGIDPLNRKAALEARGLKILSEAEKYSIDYVFRQWFISKNYENPIPSKEISAEGYLRFYNNLFIPYLKRVGLAEDIRQVSELHINTFIREKYDAGEWSAFTCNYTVEDGS